jgi:nicotinamide-nucleotide amidase
MQTLLPVAQKVGDALKQRAETIAVVESSSGGLIAASLLSIAGASAYFVGGAVSYTRKSMRELLNLSDDDFARMRGLTEPTALVMARAIRNRLSTSWAVAEIGASGPTGSRYGDAAGTSAIAVVGEREHAIVVRTGSADRVANMERFAREALELLQRQLVS